MFLIILSILLFIIFSKIPMTYCINCQDKHLYKNVCINYENNDYIIKHFNPSITQNDNKELVLAYRKSNANYKSIYTCFLSRDNYFSTLEFLTLKDNKVFSTDLKFVEDPRIIFYKNYYYVSMSYYQDQKHIFPRLYIFNCDFKLVNECQYEFYTNNIKETRRNIEKNFCLFIHDDKLFVHINVYPKWCIYSLNIHENKAICHNYIEQSLQIDVNEYPNLRCSTSWKKYKNYYIAGLHTKKFGHLFPAIRSVIVLIDSNTLLPIKISPLICFDNMYHSRIQYLSGLEVINDDTILITLGIGDYKYQIISLKNIYNLFTINIVN